MKHNHNNINLQFPTFTLLVLLPLLAVGQNTRPTKEQSKQCIEQLGRLSQQYESVCPLWNNTLVVVGKDIDPNGYATQINYGIADMDGKLIVPIGYDDWFNESDKYIVLLASTDDGYSIKSDVYDRQGRHVAHFPKFKVEYYGSYEPLHIPYFAAVKDSLWGIVDSNWNTVLPFRYKSTSYLGYNYAHVVDSNGKPFYIDLGTQAALPALSGPYEEIYPISENFFKFYTRNPYAKGSISGYVDLYGNTTATEEQMEQMKTWMKRDYNVEAIKVTGIAPLGEAQNKYATVYTCMSGTDTVGYMLVPKADTASMAFFDTCVSVDPWHNAVGISAKRYDAGLADVQLAESILPEVMEDGVFPKLGRWLRHISNPDNYKKYQRLYGFYYNDKEERCVYIQMTLEKPSFRHSIGFVTMWDACDAMVYINLNLDTRKVIKARSSSCQSY